MTSRNRPTSSFYRVALPVAGLLSLAFYAFLAWLIWA